MKPIVIFGSGDIAELAFFYFKREGRYPVAAFTVDDEFRKSETFCGLPLVPFSKLAKLYPPGRFMAFAALGYARMNKLREEKYFTLKKAGYVLASYVSPECTRLTDDIGDNCFILEDNTLQPFVTIGNNVFLWSGNHVGHHSKIGDHCFIASHVVISGGVTIGERCFIGVNATLRDHIQVASDTMIGAGSLIVQDTRKGQVYKSKAAHLSKVPSDKLKGL